MQDCGFGRCDGHHKMIDFRLEKSSGLGLLHLRLFTRRIGGWRRESLQSDVASGVGGSNLSIKTI